MEAKFILTGPQRTGKSLMLEILTRCGQDTGFTVQDFIDKKNEFFEKNWWGEHYERHAPYIIKHPRLASSLPGRVDSLGWRIDHVCIFTRDVDDCVQATVDLKRGGKTKEHRRRFFDRLGKILYHSIHNKWSYAIIHYDRFITDWSEGYCALGPLEVPFEEFEEAWKISLDRRSTK